MPLRRKEVGDQSRSPDAPSSSRSPQPPQPDTQLHNIATQDHFSPGPPAINVQSPTGPPNPHLLAPTASQQRTPSPSNSLGLRATLSRGQQNVLTRPRLPSINIQRTPSYQGIPQRQTSLNRRPVPLSPTISRRPVPPSSTAYPRQPPGGFQVAQAPPIRYQTPYIPVPSAISQAQGEEHHDGETDGRRRSTSEPQRPTFEMPDNALTRPTTATDVMPTVAEESSGPAAGGYQAPPPALEVADAGQQRTFLQRANPFRRKPVAPVLPTEESAADQRPGSSQTYDASIVDMLDVIDPEVATLSTLTNVQNSLFIPDLGRYLNRRPTYRLSQVPTAPAEMSSSDDDDPLAAAPVGDEYEDALGEAQTADTQATLQPPKMTRLESQMTIKSTLSDSRFAVLPHGTSLDGWTAQEKKDLNDHVRHMLHSKREGFKRSMKGFWQYLHRPLGFFVTLYATLITLFGLAWVLFLIGWINVGGRQLYIINVIDNVLVALFAIMGDGLAPFRAVDTYHMSFIAHYHLKALRLRKEHAMPKLDDKNDLPIHREENVGMGEELPPEEKNDGQGELELGVLSQKEEQRLDHHQQKFAKSHTFYKPHETTTHHAFPLTLLITITVLLDCHSCLQIALGTCTWAISYHTRPFFLTTVILCLSITCNITAGILITVGDHRTRKKDVVERMFRQDLTSDAINKMARRKEKEKRREQERESFKRVEEERKRQEALYREKKETDKDKGKEKEKDGRSSGTTTTGDGDAVEGRKSFGKSRSWSKSRSKSRTGSSSDQSKSKSRSQSRHASGAGGGGEAEGGKLSKTQS